MDQIIRLFKELNLTESEARVYTALLQNGLSTGYEVSKLSTVPRSKVYNTLEMLLSKGLAIATKNSSPVYYSALPVAEVIKNFRFGFENTLREVELELSAMKSKVNLDCIWHIDGYDNILNKCRNLIAQTTQELHLQIWREELEHLYEPLKKLQKNSKTRMLIILYSLDHNYEVDLKNCYRHGFEEAKLEESGHRWINLVSDNKEVLLGSIINEKSAEVVWTASSPLVFMAKEYVKHDAYCLKAIDAFPDIQSVFGRDISKIREVF